MKEYMDHPEYGVA